MTPRLTSRPAPLLALAALAAALPRAARGQNAAHGVAVADVRTIAGEVIEAESGVPLADATVALLSAEPGAVAVGAAGAAGAAPASAFLAAARRTITDATGRYRFANVSPGRYVLRVYRLGFRPATVEVELQEGASAPGVASSGAGAAEARVSVGLTVVPIRLRPVAVDAPAPEPYARRARTAAQTASARLAALRVRQARFLSTDAREITHADVEDAVTLGETDLFRALQRLPGVATQGDASAQLWTRGARWDQTRVTFDGLPLFNPLHAGGVISGVNSDAVGAAFLLPGVRPASLGEGSAAVLDLRSRAGGGTGVVRGAGELSLISARATLDGTVAGGRGAWMVAARRSYLDLILNRVIHDSTGDAFPYYLGEVTGRADWRLTGGRPLEVSALHSRDQTTQRDGQDSPVVGTPSGWGNTAARATFTTPARLGPLGAGTLRTTLGVSAYDARLGYTFTTTFRDTIFARQHVGQRLAYVTLAGEFTPAPAPDAGAPDDAPRQGRERSRDWTGGYALVTQRAAADGPLAAVYTAGVANVAPTSRRTSLPMLALWGERRLTPRPHLAVAAGLRVEAGAPVRGDGPLRLAPRLSARYQLGPTTSASATAGRHYQYIQGVPSTRIEISDPELAVLQPTPLWVGAARATPALRTDLVTAGLERWTAAGWDWTANAYARRTAGLALGDQRPGPAVARPLFAVGREGTVGLEVGVRRLVGRWTGSANYALGAATTSAYGLRFPSAEDRRHVVNATAGVRVGGGGRIGAAFTSLSGAAFTPATPATYYIDSRTDTVVRAAPPVYGRPNSVRLPAFRRLDFLAEWTWAVRRARVGGYLQLINAAGRRNPLGVPYRSAHVEDVTGRVTYLDDTYTPVPAGFVTFPLIGFRATF